MASSTITARRDGMKKRRLVIVVRSVTNGAHARTLRRWLRALVPATALVVVAAGLEDREPVEEEDTVIVNADELPSGPLSLAAALARAMEGDRLR